MRRPIYELRAAEPADSESLYRIFRAAMSVYLDEIFAWDESGYRAFHEKWFVPEHLPRISVIVGDGGDAGILDVTRSDEAININRLEIAPPFQGRGIGSDVVRAIQSEAAGRDVPVKLEVFRINPAARLYTTLGFVLTGEPDDWRMGMRWDPPALLDPPPAGS